MITRRAVVAAGLSAACRRTARRPNFLFVLADDQSYPHAGAYGTAGLKTPAFDRVAREGVLFTHSFCASPSCTPSRSCILTGRNMWQVEQAGLLYGTIPPKYPLVTHLLEDAGYYVGYTGKGWGPGDWKAAGLRRNPAGREFNAHLYPAPPREGLDKRDYAENFADFLRQRPGKAPFFFWFGSTEPHRVYARGAGLALGHRLEEVRIPPCWPDTKEVRGDVLDYCAEIEWQDQQLGRALSALEAAGEIGNTLVVVTSDNGMPFPRAKVNLYDRGVRMPLAVRWPSRVRGGRRVDDLVQHIDFMPTFLEAAQVRMPEGVAGRSLLPLLESSGAGVLDASRDAAFCGMERHVMARPDGATYPMRSIRTRDYLYIRNFAPERWPTGGEFLSSNRTTHGDVDGAPTREFMLEAGIRARFPREYELCFGRRPAEELYDVRSDPEQVRNLAPDGHPALGELRRRLEAQLKQTGDPRIEGRDPWQRYTYYQTTGYGASFNESLPEARRREAREAPQHKPE